MILVTGASGFLGSVLTRQLLAEGHTVRALRRENSKIPEFLKNAPNLTSVLGDVCDPFSLEEALDGVKQVYHTAALVSFQPKDRQKMLDINVKGTENLVNCCLEKPGIRLVHVSSVAAVGKNLDGLNCTEADFIDPNAKPSAYALAKHLSEMEVWRGIAEGLDAVIVNPSIIIGTECGWKGSGSLFSLVERGLNYYPAGSCGLVDVEDVASACIQLMNSPISGERFIINAENWLYKDFFQEIGKGFGSTGPQKKLANWQLQTGAILAEIVAKLSGKAFGLSRDMARSVSGISHYSNEKIKRTIPIQFKPIRQSIAEICRSLK